MKRTDRLLSLDVLRGITIAGMILVNNPGTWGYVYAPLRHAAWNGLTPTDLVFPFFMFIMGVSSYMSLKKFGFRLTRDSALKVIRRTVVIFAIGMALAWLGLTLNGWLSGSNFTEAVFNFDRIRILGVLPRLALSYGAGAFIALLCRHKYLPVVIAAILVTYSIILIAGRGWELSEHNVIAVVDRAVLGEAHMYTEWTAEGPIKFDPEGFLSTLPSVAHVLIGFWAGMMIMEKRDNTFRAMRLFVLGTSLAFAGFLLDYGMPVNKKIWSPTFVLTTCGLASLLFGLLIWIIDIRGHRKWCGFFEVFGANPLALYVLAALLSITTGYVSVPFAGAESGFVTLHGLVYQAFVLPLCGENFYFASLLYALMFVLLIWLAGYGLYKRKLYIRI